MKKSICSLFAGILLAYSFYCIFPTYILKIIKCHKLKKHSMDKNIMLTFDDGPDIKYTYDILNILRKNNIKATFFIVGKKAEEYPQIIKTIINEGHTVGIHSFEHKNAWFKGFEYIKRDFEKSINILNKYGYKVCYYRPPWGFVNLSILYFAKKYNLKTVLWNVMVQDWKKSNPDIVLKKLLARTKTGSVICLHDSGKDTGGYEGATANTVKALSDFIPMMINNGYKFTVLNGELL